LSKKKNEYSKDLDHLIASIVYLGTHTYYWARTPANLAAELSLSEGRLQTVFDDYPGLFRKSGKPSKSGQHFYSLQARYAQREGGNTVEPEQVSYIAPLTTDKLQMLVDFVKHAAEREQEMSLRMLSNGIAVLAALVSAASAIFIAFAKSG
jgi:hypothetical protein